MEFFSPGGVDESCKEVTEMFLSETFRRRSKKLLKVSKVNLVKASARKTGTLWSQHDIKMRKRDREHFSYWFW